MATTPITGLIGQVATSDDYFKLQNCHYLFTFPQKQNSYKDNNNYKNEHVKAM